MKNIAISLSIGYFLLLSSCSKNLTSIPDKLEDQIATTYSIKKDVSYGMDDEQKMDIYLSNEAKSYGKNNFTIVFIHGGAYYLSDKTKEERYIEPYLKKGLNVVNINYRLKRGIPMATSDLTNSLNYLLANNKDYNLNLKHVIVTGFSAGAHMASIVGVTQNNPNYPYKLNKGVRIVGVINFSGPVDGLDDIEKIFVDHENELFSKAGKALFPLSHPYETKETIAIYEPITYLDANDPAILVWHGGKDDQVPPQTFETFVQKLDSKKDRVVFKPEAFHSPNSKELKEAYIAIFKFLDSL